MPPSDLRELHGDLVEGIFILAGRIYKQHGKHLLAEIHLDRDFMLSGGIPDGTVVQTAVGPVTLKGAEVREVGGYRMDRNGIWRDVRGGLYRGPCSCGAEDCGALTIPPRDLQDAGSHEDR
jgi:hypothetical protein